MKQNLVSVIVLNWNSKQHIHSCLDSLFTQDYSDLEIIVVDNGSKDGSLEDIEHHYQERIKLIKNPTNLGFAKGVNIGIEASSGEYIALLNSDATADPQWITEMIKGIQTSESIGMIACKIYLADKENTLDNVGLVLSQDGQNRCKGRLEKDTGQYSKQVAALCPSGCAGLYERKIFNEIGGFEEKFFAYGEDVEIGLRAQYAGYECLYVPTAIVTHALSGSTHAYDARKVYLVERNRIWVVLKCFPLKSILKAIACSFLRYFYLLLGLFQKKGPSHQFGKRQSPFLLPYLAIKAHFSTLIHLPYLLSRRREVRKKGQMCRFHTLIQDYGISVKNAALDEVS